MIATVLTFCITFTLSSYFLFFKQRVFIKTIMFLKSQICPDLIGFLLICLQSFETCFTLNTIEFQEINYLASNLTPNECFQLYDMFQNHMRRDEILNYIQKRSHTIPCITLLSTWLTDPDELNYPTFDNVTSKLTKIGREDLAFQLNRSLIHRRNKKNFSGAKDLEDERQQRSTCPSETSEMKIFWEIFLGVLTILSLLFLCICCYFCICEKLRCTCSRTDLNYCGNKEEKEEEYCLCGDNFKTTSFEDYYTNKKESSHFKKVLSNFQQYFKNRKEKKKEKLRHVRFQKLKRKLQKMYFEQRKEIRVNRQEEKILNSLTEEERNELGEIICEMRFFLDSDKETERLLLSGKRSATFIIDMKNLHQPKITRTHVSNQEIKTIKKWESGDKFSTSLSEGIATYISQPKTSSESEILRSNREKKSHKNSNSHKKKVSKQYLENKRDKQISQHVELEVKSEFLKCYPMSESDQNYSSPVTRQGNQRFLHESDWKSNFSTSEESELSTFRSENQLEKFQNPTQIAYKMQSDIESQKKNFINVIKSKSMIELESMKVNDISKLSSQQEKIKTTNDKQNRGDYLNNDQNKSCNLTKKINKTSSRSIRNFNSCWSFTARYNKRNLKKSNENIDPVKNSDRGDNESQLDLCEIYDELGFLFSQHMKQQSHPCYRKYCLLRRHLKQKTHDLKQCKVKKNYFQYYPKGQAPSCSSGNVCRDTYDEFNLMRASPRERKKIRQLVYERRKKFLDQPCISPGRQVLQVLSI